MKIKIGTRGSKLALTQTEYVKKRLEKAYPQHKYEICIIKTKGDMIKEKPLREIGGRGLFVKEIEEMILDGEIQLGVHSMKDMPQKPEEGLVFSKMWQREDARDVLILREASSLSELPYGAVIGTGSERRKRQLKSIRSDLKIVDIRGNVDTRLKKMEDEKLDGIVLAAAGLKRLGMEDKITYFLSEEEMISAPAQGILALEVREDNTELLDMLNSLSDDKTDINGRAERAFLSEMGGDCHTPLGAYCDIENEKLCLRAVCGRKTGDKLYYAEVSGTEPDEVAKKAAEKIRKQMAGKVYLAGGGTGDEELITVKGMKVIQRADCIIYDRLTSHELLKAAPVHCEKIYAGKENRHHTMKQEDINRLLIKKAMEYDTVVRLKGGDPYVFGRGGEEALALKESGIPFEIIPGVSSPIAGLAYAGIPITHRGIAAGFRVVTAHGKNDEISDIDYKSIAAGKETCVFMMGLARLSEIAENLIKAGMDKKTQTAVISNAATPKQKTVVADLEHIEEKVKSERITSPALIAVGNTINLREYLNFYEEKPLFGKKYIIPKIGEAQSKLSQMLKEYGAETVEIKTGEIKHIKYSFTKEQIKTVDWLVFTSTNGIDGFFENLINSGMDARDLCGIKIAVIGKSTGVHLKKYGLCPDLIPEEYNSEALCEALKKEIQSLIDENGKTSKTPLEVENGKTAQTPLEAGNEKTARTPLEAGNEKTTQTPLEAGKEKITQMPLEAGKVKVCYPSAFITDGTIEETLKDICNVEKISVYENEKTEIEKTCLAECEKAEAVVFTSASSAERIINSMGNAFMQDIDVISIGKKCTRRLAELGITKTTQSDEASYKSIVETILKQS